MAFDINIYDCQTNNQTLNIQTLNNTENQILKSDFKDYSICNMCHTKIKDCGLYSINHDLIFCDLICAKIYSDNVEKINIDSQLYRNNYVMKKLSSNAEKIYLKYKYKFFQQLPILLIKNENKNELHQCIIENDIKKYRTIFKEIKSEF